MSTDQPIHKRIYSTSHLVGYVTFFWTITEVSDFTIHNIVVPLAYEDVSVTDGPVMAPQFCHSFYQCKTTLVGQQKGFRFKNCANSKVLQTTKRAEKWNFNQCTHSAGANGCFSNPAERLLVYEYLLLLHAASKTSSCGEYVGFHYRKRLHSCMITFQDLYQKYTTWAFRRTLARPAGA